jgi:hypothetical protein
MNTVMWKHTVTNETIQKLSAWGHAIIQPVSKKLACNDIGSGALAEVSTIVDVVRNAINMKFLEQECSTFLESYFLERRRKRDGGGGIGKETVSSDTTTSCAGSSNIRTRTGDPGIIKRKEAEAGKSWRRLNTNNKNKEDEDQGERLEFMSVNNLICLATIGALIAIVSFKRRA